MRRRALCLEDLRVNNEHICFQSFAMCLTSSQAIIPTQILLSKQISDKSSFSRTAHAHDSNVAAVICPPNIQKIAPCMHDHRFGSLLVIGYHEAMRGWNIHGIRSTLRGFMRTVKTDTTLTSLDRSFAGQRRPEPVARYF